MSARFSAAAQSYDKAAMTQFQTTLKLMRFLEDIDPPGRILDIGCGTGQLTRLVADKFPQAEMEAIDIAAKAIAVAGRRFMGGGKISLTVADATTFTAAKPFHLIISGASFHWIQPLDKLFKNIARNLVPDGKLAFSMMLRGTLGELRESRARSIRNKPAPADLPALEEVMEAVAAAKLNVVTCETESMRTEYASVTEFLYTLHNTGVTGGTISSSGTPLNRSELATLLADYMEHYMTEDGGVFASYKVLYAVAEHKR